MIQNVNFVPIKNFQVQFGKKIREYSKIRQPLTSTVEREFLFYIKDKVSNPKIILDMGSRNGVQSIEFANAFPNAKVYAFECNPPNIRKCIRNTRNIKNIEIIPKAVFNKNGRIKFYSGTTKNDGVSSLYKASGNYDEIEKITQTEIYVDAIRIDTWAKENNINKIDLCWMDLQGAEYEALESIGNLINQVDAIFIELELQEIYRGQKLYDDVVNFLKQKKFSMIKFHTCLNDWWGNAIFLNNKLTE